MVDNYLCFLLDSAQVGLASEALGVNFIDVLGTGRTRGKPAALSHNFHAADARVIARRFGEDSLDFLARQFGELYLLR